ncbi:MAG: serine/threonine-protein kinase [Pseudomonadota bacterium]
MKKRFWSRDWFTGVLAILAVLILAGTTRLVDSLDRAVYDWGVRSAAATPADNIAIIAIDEQSIANIGRWPWSRDKHARLIDLLRDSNAKVIGYTVFFLEEQLDPGFEYIREILDFYVESGVSAEANAIDDPGRRGRVESSLAELEAMLFDAESSLNTDEALRASIERAGNVVLPMLFSIGEPLGNPDSPLPPFVSRYVTENLVDNVSAYELGLFPIPADVAYPPIAAAGLHAAGVGHLTANPDVDGSIRFDPLFINYYQSMFPSLAVSIAAQSLNLKADDIQIQLGEGVRLGNLSIATDTELQMNTFFYNDVNGAPAFTVDSFYDVITGKIPLQKYADKIVLIGAIANGVGDTQVTPIDARMAPVVTLAHSVSSILNEDFYVKPIWAHWVTMAAFVLIAAYVLVGVPRLKAGTAALITLTLLVALLGTHMGLMISQSMWIPLVLPATLLVLGHLTITTKRFLATERGKLHSDAESAESNRMLGLAFQGQGQLDMAFEKFRKCPLDDSIMEILYNLGLDFERKRQFNKAGAVFIYMSEHDASFRDIDKRQKRAENMENTVMLGGGSGTTGASLLLGGDGIEKPKLGRYEVEKELGKGAMGIVYLGKDPKISRVVAIKTLALAQEFEEDELEDVKERFFREAETAGRLNHPNIVTIYDAGEEHDLAYIAMEFLSGHEMTRYTKHDKLLPVPLLMGLMCKSAEALDYAHGNNVVHRDIKPANMMFEPKSRTISITDFGIARITDSSKTKTGMVLGTPSYMSPEQLSGQKVDGRSDLFSLGVMFYQMLTGKLPFHGDSMAALMYQIANEKHQDARKIRPNLPPCLSTIVNRLLAKKVDERYQRGNELANDLRACAKTFVRKKPAPPKAG